jgi:hypothetical protein
VRSLPRLSLTLLLLLVPLVPASAQQSAAPIDAGRLKLIRELLEQNRVADGMARSMLAALPSQRQAHPEVPAEFWDAFMRKAQEQIPMLIDSLVPIYAKHYSQDDLEHLLTFYRTPTGQHLLAEQPAILGESMDLGRRWGMLIGAAVGDSMTRAHQ